MDHYIRTDPISVLHLSTRLHNVLCRNGIRTVGALMDIEESQWKTFQRLGTKSIDEAREVIETLQQLPEKLAPELPPVPEKMKEGPSPIPLIGTFYETSLEEYDLSVRLSNCLKKAGIDTVGKLLEFPEDQWLTLRNMGEKSVKEVLALVASLKDQVGEVPAHAPELDEEQLTLAKELEENYAVANVQRVLFQITLAHPGCMGETLLYLAYENPLIQDAFYKKVLGFLKDRRQGLTLEQISRRLPQHLQNTTILEEALLNLQNDDKIQEMDGIYIRKFPSIMEYLAKRPDEKNREITIRRLSGGKLEEIGAQFNLTRERVRQICIKACKVPRAFEEDRYRYPFETYEVDEKSFLAIFHVPVTTYHYLETVCKVKTNSRKPLIDILEDDTFSPAVLRSAEAYIYRDYLSVDGLRIPKTRPDLFRYVVKTYCKNKRTFAETVEIYHQFLDAHGLLEMDNLQMKSRSYENRIGDRDCDYALANFHHGLRYYNVSEQDYTQLIEEINLSQYEGLEISTLKIFRELPELMEQYDIRDEFELHNLLKKIWGDWGDAEVHFATMPMLQFGNFNAEEQVLDLLLQCAPITAGDFAKRVEDAFGFRSETAKGGLLRCLDAYLDKGMYTIDQKALAPEQHARMQEILTEDYYTLSDLQRIFEREFPDATERLNAYNIKTLGFSIYNTYVVSKQYTSAAVYFRHLLHDPDIVDATQLPASMTGLVSYYSELSDLRHERDILEFQPKKYINIRRLSEHGVTADSLDEYCRSVWKYVDPDCYFTIYSLRQDGFTDSLDDLYFDDWFYSSILAEDREHFSYRRMGGTRLLYSGQKDVTLAEFLEDILEKEKRIELYDLLNLLSDRYDIQVSRDNLAWTLKDTDLYYDRIMDTVYIDYDTYFEEV